MNSEEIIVNYKPWHIYLKKMLSARNKKVLFIYNYDYYLLITACQSICQTIQNRFIFI